MRPSSPNLLELDTDMSMVMEDIDLREMLDNVLSCQGIEHPNGRLGHDGGPAVFLVLSPCGCHKGGVLQCAGRSAYMRAHPTGTITCSRCRHSWDVRLWRFIPV